MSLAANPYLGFGPDSDAAAWAALLGAVLCALAARSSRQREFWLKLPARVLLPALGLSAALLSWGYVVHYLRGGPRIIDSAYYYLAGRTFAQGELAFSVPDPVAAFRGRFSLSPPAAHTLSVLFPPGYPAALALAFKLGSPLLLGPLIAGGLVLLVYRLSQALGASEREARCAAALCVCSAALRYHTADTMSHGFAALLLLSALLAAARERTLLCAACLGWLCATRPVSGAVALALIAAWRVRSVRAAALFALGLAPFVALVALAQHAATGDWLQSSALRYYRLADGPPGCFAYGFGEHIGCLFEHGDYVRARLPHGLTLGAALATTLRRLLVHSEDIANFAPFALLVPFGAWRRRQASGGLLLPAVCLGVIAGYVPFYFEGSFPGGGARFFAELIPLELILLARALSELRSLGWALPLSLAGFALHTSGQHRALRDREGGRPMFEPAVLARAGVTRGLVFVSTDHGFALGFDPAVHSAREGVLVARERGDAVDRLLWEQQGSPPTYRYTYDTRSNGALPRLEPYLPSSGNIGCRRVEAESLWPPSDVRGGWVRPDYPPQACASRGRGLRLMAPETSVTLALPLAATGHLLRLGWIGPTPQLALFADEQRLANPTWDTDRECLRSSEFTLPAGAATLSIESMGSEGVLDYLEWCEKSVDN